MNKIYTIGYTGMKPEQLLALVNEKNAFLVDIRYSPHSRVPHWEGANLAQLLGDNYLWLKALGNENYGGNGAIKLHDPQYAVGYLRAFLELKPIILLCACKDWRTCHRMIAADYLMSYLGAQVEHLEPLKKSKAVTA